ncbi:alpha/beta fold hydrolase [Candidatus Rhodoluna planktonica]|uniref:Serine aminopeptidase S33 domain-containing protein n=1 Tax=Candidatus Rhodoluna planktonica TaxID=535712 RepID=A0A1D9E0R3_9MICO|nr:alpha/beta hydrolase [Candidatus Rhodoluna planktonica]AOY56610.1 hypothetical protein A4Z71_06645 [Candidatus Rhodoluna planktonica]
MTALPLVRSFNDSFNVPITFYEWPVTNPKAIVQIAHGLGEHARRYDHVAAAFNRAGFSVYADDHRGHGETGLQMIQAGTTKNKGNLGPGGMTAVFKQVHQLGQLIKDENPNLPIIFIGHSWGSMIGQRILDRWPSDYAAVVLSGSTLLLPGVLPSGNFNKKYAAQRKAAGLPISGGEWLSRDLKVGERFAVDPRNFVESALQVFGAVNAAKLYGVPKRTVPNALPILLIAGSDDVIGGEKGNLKLANAFAKAGVKDLETIIYQDGRHELFNEINQDEVIADVIDWINERL